MFTLERSKPLKLATRVTEIKIFKHLKSKFRMVFVDLPGPLCSASIVVPTTATNDKGLAHTLEHLIFCGSKNYPHRGYLDYLATRALSTGTNAYTTEDHTAYTITTAGSQGMLDLLPVYMDHVLNPTLRPAQFNTEVYHLDGEGKHQGVVYCEMASRENTEEDLLDLNMRKLLFQGQTTYSYECGGLSRKIQHLTNEEIIKYHEKFYHLDNLTVILCGSISPETCFERLDYFLDSKQRLDCRKKANTDRDYQLEQNNQKDESQVHESQIHEGTARDSVPVIPEIEPILSPKPLESDSFRSLTVPFPSGEESIGTIAYGWRGPKSNQIEELAALDILLAYLQDTASSPLRQEFVERLNPLASDVDYDLKFHVDTCITLTFSGVSYRVNEEAMDESADESMDASMDTSMDASIDESMSESMDESVDNSNRLKSKDAVDLFKNRVFAEMMLKTLGKTLENLDSDRLNMCIKRQHRKLLESLEDDPHEYLSYTIILDVIRLYLCRQDEPLNADIGSRADMFGILESISKKPFEFWIELGQKWLLNAALVEVKMVPDSALATQLAQVEAKELEERKKALGKKGLQTLQENAKMSVQENTINIPQPVINRMPRIPALDDIPRIPCKSFIVEFQGQEHAFSAAHHVETETAFVHLRFGLNTDRIPLELRPFLVLFQEVFFQSDILLNGDTTSPELLPYTDLVDKCSRTTISHEAALGFGNDIYHTSWLSEMFMFSATCEPEKVDETINLLQTVFFDTWFFDKERIMTIVENLLSIISEAKRSGPEMLVALTARVTCGAVSGHSGLASLGTDASTHGTDASTHGYDGSSTINPSDTCRRPVSNQGNVCGVDQGPSEGLSRESGQVSTEDQSKKPTKTNLQNDLFISIFQQEALLQKILKKCTKDKANVIMDKLQLLRTILLQSPGDVGGFLHVAGPVGFDTMTIQNKFIEKWQSKTCKNSLNSFVKTRQSPFPFPRTPYSLSKHTDTCTRSVLVQINGLQTYFLSQIVPCNVLGNLNDYFPVMVLAELLSRTEGPLYTAIRGKGYAYGASLDVYLWSGQLVFQVYDSSEPQKALIEFYKILEYLNTDEGFGQLCHEFHVDTSKASAAFRNFSAKASAGSLISTCLRNALRGFTSIEQEELFQLGLYNVGLDDLKRCLVYLNQFLNPDSRVTVMTSVAGKQGNQMMMSFCAPALSPQHQVKFKKMALKDFNFPVDSL